MLSFGWQWCFIPENCTVYDVYSVHSACMYMRTYMLQSDMLPGFGHNCVPYLGAKSASPSRSLPQLIVSEISSQCGALVCHLLCVKPSIKHIARHEPDTARLGRILTPKIVLRPVSLLIQHLNQLNASFGNAACTVQSARSRRPIRLRCDNILRG